MYEKKIEFFLMGQVFLSGLVSLMPSPQSLLSPSKRFANIFSHNSKQKLLIYPQNSNYRLIDDNFLVLIMVERPVGTLFEGVPFFGQRTDFSGSNVRYSGSKRSNSDSGFIPLSRESIPQLRPDFPETSHLMKVNLLSNLHLRCSLK